MHGAARLLVAAAIAGCATRAERPPSALPIGAAAPPVRDASSGGNSQSDEQIGRAVVSALAAGEFAKVTAHFDEKLKAVLPEAALRETWQRVLQRSGAFLALGDSRLERQDEHRLVHVRTRFAQAELETRVALDAAGRVSGFFIRPLGQPSAEYEPPAYADPKKFSEREVRVPHPSHPCASGTCGLPGTLTLPVGTGPFPALVLVHGSGPRDRDEALGLSRPFKDLAWGLASQGVVVLRYDKRTFFLEGRMSAAELELLTLKEEAIDDALGAVKLLKSTLEVDPKRIFVLGHSQGGTALPRIAKAEASIAGFVSLAGSTRPLEDVVLEQVRYLAGVDGQQSDDEKAAIQRLEAQVLRVKSLRPDSRIDAALLPLGIPAKYWLDLAAHPPARVVLGETRPFLILQGERDYQVTLADFRLWQGALNASPRAIFKTYAKLNHCFVSGEGPSTPSDYQVLGHVAEQVVRDVVEFVRTAR